MTDSGKGVEMTSLKTIAAGVVASHDLLDSHKHNLRLTTSTQQSFNIRCTRMSHLHVLTYSW